MKREGKGKVFLAISLALQLGFFIALPLIVFLLIGFFLDKKFQSQPLFLVVSILLCFLFLFFEVKRLLLPFLKKDD